MAIKTIVQLDLKNNSKRKLDSSKALLNASHYNDAIYLAGYSIELALKYKFCTKLNIDFPEKIDEIYLFATDTKTNRAEFEFFEYGRLRSEKLTV